VSFARSQIQIGDIGLGARVAVGENISMGIPPEHLPAIIKAATDPLEKLSQAQNDSIALLERELGANKEQVFGFFRIIGEAAIAPEAIPTRLYEVAERYKALLGQATAEPGDDPEMALLRAELRTALEKPDLERADALFGELLAAEERNLERRALQNAATWAQRGELALTRLRYNEAAAHFASAAARLPAAHDSNRINYLSNQAQALYLQGAEFGDNAALRAAVQLLQTLLDLCLRRDKPLDWAMTQNNLGNALSTLGRRESGTARLEEAVTAYRAAR
jgi:tetratricopeptide (TPR) repeat protein